MAILPFVLVLVNLTGLAWLFAHSPRHRWVAVGLIIALIQPLNE